MNKESKAANRLVDEIEAEGRYIGRTKDWPTDPDGKSRGWFCRTCGALVLDRDLHDRWHAA